MRDERIENGSVANRMVRGESAVHERAEGRWQSGEFLDSLAGSAPVHWIVLLSIGAFAFFYNLQVALFEGSEGLYAQIAREMVRGGDYFRLSYMGETYVNKPPLFFWMLAGSTSLFGENEVALRLPGALFSVGTMALAYGLGRMLFSRKAGFWAAVVVASTHVSLWYGRRVLFDATLTFFITLAIYAWVRAHLNRGGSWWYTVSFVAMALGTMTKGLHGLALPLVVFVIYVTVRRDVGFLKDPWFLVGPILCVLSVVGYASALSGEFRWHYDFWSRLATALGLGASDATAGGHPFYWYLYMMWFDLFPWCALFVPSLLLLVRNRPMRDHPSELFVLAWVAGLFAALTVGQPKREPYMMPVVPAMGVMVGALYHHVFAAHTDDRPGPLLKIMMSGLALAFIAALVVGPYLLEKRWETALAPFPVAYVVAMVVLCGAAIYTALRRVTSAALLACGALAAGFLVGVVGIVLPAIDEATSARRVSEEIKRFARHADHPVRLYGAGWPTNEDLEFYLSSEPALHKIRTERELLELARSSGQVLVITEKKRYPTLVEQGDLAITLLREFPQPRKKSVLLLTLRPKHSRSVVGPVAPSPYPHEAARPLL